MRLLLICAFLLSNCNPNPYNFDINDPQFSPPPGILGMGNSQSQFDKPSNRSQQNPQSTYGSQNNPQPLYESQQNPQSQYK